MHADIVDLRQFYHSELGRLAEQSIAMALSSLWARLPEERLVGLGYSVPYLDRFRADTERTFAFMPAGQGAVNWPMGSAVVDGADLRRGTAAAGFVDRPRADGAFAGICRKPARDAEGALAGAGARRAAGDRGAEPPRRLGADGAYALRLGPALFARPADGAAARDEFHARSDRRSAVLPALEAASRSCRLRRAFERIGRTLWPVFSGVIIVEAQKRLYQGLPVAVRASRRVFVPVLAPRGVPTTREESQPQR